MNAAELTDSLAEAWDALLHTPLFGIALTLAIAFSGGLTSLLALTLKLI